MQHGQTDHVIVPPAYQNSFGPAKAAMPHSTPPAPPMSALEEIFGHLASHGNDLQRLRAALKASNDRIFGVGPDGISASPPCPPPTIGGILSMISDLEGATKLLWDEVNQLQKLA